MSDAFFTERIACISLPPSIVDFRSLLSFKKTINHVHVIYLHDVDSCVLLCNLHCHSFLLFNVLLCDMLVAFGHL